MKSLVRRLRSIPLERHPVRFMVGRMLWATGLSRAFQIARPGFRLRFYPSAISAAYWTDPAVYAAEEELVRRLLAPGDVFVDVGANIGSLALAAASVVGPTGRVVAVEPHPRTFGYLLGNIRLNRFSNVTAHQCALGAVPGSVTLQNRRADNMNAVQPHGAVGTTVPMRTLDELAVDTGSIALLKIDVEGYEKFVLTGGARTLARARAVLIEVAEAHFRPLGYSTGELVGMLEDAGFHCFRFGDAHTLAPVGRDYVPPVVENVIATRDVADVARRGGLGVASGTVSSR